MPNPRWPLRDCVSQERADILHLVELPNFDQTLGPRASGHAFGKFRNFVSISVSKGDALSVPRAPF